jgi:aryl-phospho-beta-D-glucosidase BglC (GH1 family)
MRRLHASGNQLWAGHHPIRLRGVNRSGLEYSRTAPSAEELDQIASWGANFLRVPFNQQWLLSEAAYLDQLTEVAELCLERKLYVLYDLQWLAYGQHRGSDSSGNNIATPPLPDADSPHAWQKMAARFGKHPAVLFDLLNEPHDRLRDDPFPLVAADGRPLHSSTVSQAVWHSWVRRLAEAIRPDAPETLLFVSGIDWGFTCAEVDVKNVVYAAHVYPYPGRRLREDWERGFAHLARRQPVVVTELGPLHPPDDLDKVAELIDFLDELDLGWAAWSWRDWPQLVEADGQPTPFGELVRSRLGRPSLAVA